MVLLFGNKNNVYEKEIFEILKNYKINFISENKIITENEKLTIVSINKPTKIMSKTGIAVFLNESEIFQNQTIPNSFIGICNEDNTSALEICKNNNLNVICCGMNSKNTVTFSSIKNNILLISLQRNIININNNEIEPCEYKIKLKRNYHKFSILASFLILILNGIIPEDFWGNIWKKQKFI